MITIDEAKSHLRIDHNDEDADIAFKLRMAVAIVTDYIGTPGNYDPDVFDAAVLLVLGELYQNREAGSANVLSPTVKLILERSRVPALA